MAVHNPLGARACCHGIARANVRYHSNPDGTLGYGAARSVAVLTRRLGLIAAHQSELFEQVDPVILHLQILATDEPDRLEPMLDALSEVGGWYKDVFRVAEQLEAVSMKIGFVGAVESSGALLSATLRAGGNIVALGTLPPDVGGSRHSDYVDLSPLAAKADIPVYNLFESGRIAEMIDEARLDILFVFGWSRLIPVDQLNRIPMGGIGFHPAPLPVGRGRHPLIWSIILGLRESAVTFMRLSDEADTGPIVLQQPFKIDADETARGLMDKVLEVGAEAMPQLLEIVGRNGVMAAVPQDDTKASVWRKRSRADGRIDFRMPRRAVDRLVRALSEPYPGADAVHADIGDIRVHRVTIPSDVGDFGPIEPGRVVEHRDGYPVVTAADGVVVLTEYSGAGGDRPEIMPGSWFC